MNKIYLFQPVHSKRNNKYYLKAWLHFKSLFSMHGSRNQRLVKRQPRIALSVSTKCVDIKRKLKMINRI